MMLTVIQKWDNHQGLPFTPEILDKAQMFPGDQVLVTVRPGEIIIKPMTPGKDQDISPKLMAQAQEQISKKRTVGEYIGKIHLSDDFDAPLPDEFWLGELDK